MMITNVDITPAISEFDRCEEGCNVADVRINGVPLCSYHANQLVPHWWEHIDLAEVVSKTDERPRFAYLANFPPIKQQLMLAVAPGGP